MGYIARTLACRGMLRTAVGRRHGQRAAGVNLELEAGLRNPGMHQHGGSSKNKRKNGLTNL